jgi:EPS-associated MarR family transcriptional regulator
MLDETTHYILLKTLEENPGLSQRDLAKKLGISLGKVNFCLKALVDKGSVKINNFRNSENKLAYAYLLTPNGIEQKTRMTVEFLQMKMREYERLKKEIETLQHEAKQLGVRSSNGDNKANVKIGRAADEQPASYDEILSMPEPERYT